MARKKPHGELLEKARIVHLGAQRIRSFILRGPQIERVWRGASKEPTFAQIRAMLALHGVGPCTLKTFAEALGVGGPTASERVEGLVEMGLVTRQRNPENRREVLIELTPEAGNQISHHEGVILGHICELLEKMGPESTDQWVELSRKVLNVLNPNGKSSAGDNAQ